MGPILAADANHEWVASLDYAKAFDRVQPQLSCRILQHLGADPKVMTFLNGCWSNQLRWIQLQQNFDPRSEKVSTSLLQGDAWSMLAMTAALLPATIRTLLPGFLEHVAFCMRMTARFLPPHHLNFNRSLSVGANGATFLAVRKTKPRLSFTTLLLQVGREWCSLVLAQTRSVTASKFLATLCRGCKLAKQSRPNAPGCKRPLAQLLRSGACLEPWQERSALASMRCQARHLLDGFVGGPAKLTSNLLKLLVVPWFKNRNRLHRFCTKS